MPDLLSLPDDALLAVVEARTDDQLAALPPPTLAALRREIGLRLGAAVARREQAKAALAAHS